MKFLVSLVTISLLCSGVAIAQTQSDKPAPSASDMKIVAGNQTKHRRHADARHCLDFKTNLKIIRCAEKYR
jgi:hypothetical protein